MDISKLIASNKIISDQIDRKSLKIVLDSLKLTLENNIDGDIVEFGCYKGTTSLFIRRILDFYKSDKKYYVYDSFEGLPNKSVYDDSIIGSAFKEGELKASKKELVINFIKSGLELPIILKGWFNEIKASDVPSKISFAFLDGDFFDSISESLKIIEDLVVKGGVIVVDDYDNPKLPGVKRAVDLYLIRTRFKSRKIANEIVILVE